MELLLVVLRREKKWVLIGGSGYGHICPVSSPKLIHSSMFISYPESEIGNPRHTEQRERERATDTRRWEFV